MWPELHIWSLGCWQGGSHVRRPKSITHRSNFFSGARLQPWTTSSWTTVTSTLPPQRILTPPPLSLNHLLLLLPRLLLLLPSLIQTHPQRQHRGAAQLGLHVFFLKHPSFSKLDEFELCNWYKGTLTPSNSSEPPKNYTALSTSSSSRPLLPSLAKGKDNLNGL